MLPFTKRNVYVNDTFLSWLNIDASQTNTRGLYCNILRCNYLSSELTAVKKLCKIPMIGSLDEERVCNAMRKIVLGINTARSLRASIEFALGGFRSNIEISFFTNEKQIGCFCCGIIEKYKIVNEKGRDPIFHLLYDGARFLRSHLKNYARRILGQSFDININSIVFNELIDIVKRCDIHTLRGWYSLMNIYKVDIAQWIVFLLSCERLVGLW